MIEATQILWTPAGQNLSSLGSKALIDVSDGDTPNIRMPIRMLSIETPEARHDHLAAPPPIDEEFKQLATWIKSGTAPVSKAFADYILPSQIYNACFLLPTKDHMGSGIL